MARLIALPLLVVFLPPSAFLTPVSAAGPPLAEKYLTAGQLAAGQAALDERLKSQPDDDEARFGLGTLQFVGGVERLGQSLFKFGAVGPESRLGRQIPLLRLAVPKNPAPAKVRYADVREILREFQADLL